MARPHKEINIRLVAQEAEVSVATVSRVVNNRTDVSESVRRRVREIIDKYRFSTDKGKERVSNLGFIISTDNPTLSEYTAQVLDGVSRYSSENNVATAVIMDCRNIRHKPLLQIIRERRCDGVAVITAEKLVREIEELDDAGIPTMLINNPIKRASIGFVNNESYSGARQAAAYLIQLGHRRIGFLCNNMESSENHQQRLAGYRDAMTAAGLEVDPAWVIPHQPTEQTPEAGFRQAQTLFRQAPDVTAIFAANDEMAFGTIKACWDSGRRVPADISVIGFDDIPFSSYMHPALSTVRQPLCELGYRAMRYLDAFIKGSIGELPGDTLGTELVIRESTAPARN